MQGTRQEIKEQVRELAHTGTSVTYEDKHNMIIFHDGYNHWYTFTDDISEMVARIDDEDAYIMVINKLNLEVDI